jgi:hypothetical protein
MAKPSEVIHVITRCLEVQQPLFIWGEPGIGKSSLAGQVAKLLDRPLRDIRLSLVDSVDLRGFPFPKDGRMEFLVPSFLPTDPDSIDIIFLDELNLASGAVQNAAYQLINDRKIGDYHLPTGVGVIAAGNREADGGYITTMAPALANRFLHIDFNVDFDDWRAWAIANNQKPEVVNFINFRPGLLHDFDQDKRAFPTPRSWEFVSRVLSDTELPSSVEKQMIAGSIGDGAAGEFISFLKIYRNLPNPDAVLMSPLTATVPDDLATLYALCGSLSVRASTTNFDRLVQYCNRLSPEFQVLCIRDAVVRNRDLSNTKTFSDWAIKNSHTLS